MGTAGKEIGLLRDLQSVGLLVIDEIQERAETKYEETALVYLIDQRYANMRPTLLIGNIKHEDFTARIGPSIASRIRETGGVIEFTGPSFRDKPRK
jgi:DNA replication protein DnaC